MSAPARPVAVAPQIPTAKPRHLAAEHWYRAAEITREWLDIGLSTRAADREVAEASITTIYARLGRGRPNFIWVDSPHAALSHLAGLPTLDVLHRWVMAPPSTGTRPLASDLAAGLSRLRSALEECLTRAPFDPPPPKRKDHQPWPTLAPLAALEFGIPFAEVLRQNVRESLRVTLADGLYLPIRGALTMADQRPMPVCWYGQQDAYWIAYYDTWRRLGLARFGRTDDADLDVWAALARSGGWWWPSETRCVMVERPLRLPTEPALGVLPEQVRVRRDAIAYRDGWQPHLSGHATP